MTLSFLGEIAISAMVALGFFAMILCAFDVDLIPAKDEIDKGPAQ